MVAVVGYFFYADAISRSVMPQHNSFCLTQKQRSRLKGVIHPFDPEVNFSGRVKT